MAGDAEGVHQATKVYKTHTQHTAAVFQESSEPPPQLAGIGTILLLISITLLMLVYLGIRLFLAFEEGQDDMAQLLVISMAFVAIIPSALTTMIFLCQAKTFRAFLVGLMDIYFSVLIIIVLALIADEALVALESPAEEERREACLAYNARLHSIAADLRADLKGGLANRAVSALAFRDCTFREWTSGAYAPIFFALTVITTIGYGTTSPQTQGGRLFVGLYAVPAIGFTVYCLSRVASRIERATIWLLARLVPPSEAIDEIFEQYDVDGSGTLQYQEFFELMSDLQDQGILKIDMRQFGDLMRAADRDGNESVNVNEFKRAVEVMNLDVRTFAITQYKTIVVVGLNAIMILLLCFVEFEVRQGEVWTRIDNFYFTIVTLSTVGLGDLAPRVDTPGRIAIFIIFCVAGLGLFATLVSSLSDFISTAVAHCKRPAKNGSGTAPGERRRRPPGGSDTGSIAGAGCGKGPPSSGSEGMSQGSPDTLGPGLPMAAASTHHDRDYARAQAQAQAYDDSRPNPGGSVGGSVHFQDASRPPPPGGHHSPAPPPPPLAPGRGQPVPFPRAPGDSLPPGTLVVRTAGIYTAGFDLRSAASLDPGSPMYVGAASMPMPAPPRSRMLGLASRPRQPRTVHPGVYGGSLAPVPVAPSGYYGTPQSTNIRFC
eukprot:CAMPEP_0206040782 /NCGR_PEP_ID=MMETSP1466-20131121/5578_1 /ASSEMBLY_ACC=CAM_ASM_001126 /TAXON_ID=44452 /ORGANISM="Pavlova gyrans, Strain CCMP608" /LENGTH=658 /DNA_ID=CAMNT_0053415463 /DNA_START=104 /DNA_END=2080 /DNA_ORIENTATION=+